jgi:hypothetical protein
MIRLSLGVVGAALLATALLTGLVLPAAAQQPGAATAPRSDATAPGTPSAAVSDAVVAKTGAAVRQVAAIRKSYGPRIAAADNDSDRQGLQQQAMAEAAKAINDQGLSLEQYNHVIELAQADPTLGKRVISAVQSGQ